MLRLRAYLTQVADLAADLLGAVESRDVDSTLEVLRRVERLSEPSAAAWNRLGAAECGNAGDGSPLARLTVADGLEWLLHVRRPAVVVFYTPESGLDGVAVHEARAGALEAGAPFLAVDVGRNRVVAELAETYEVLEAPAVLVVERGRKVAARFDRFVDRETVAQAVENARG